MSFFGSITGDGLLGAGGNILGGVVSGLFANHNQKKQNNYNQYMWHLQNAYNSPTAQMKRLKDAGLNPYLYANSISGNQAGSPVPSANGYTGDLGVADAVNHVANARERQKDRLLKEKAQKAMLSRVDDEVKGLKLKNQNQAIQNRILQKQLDFLGDRQLMEKQAHNDMWNERILNNQYREKQYNLYRSTWKDRRNVMYINSVGNAIGNLADTVRYLKGGGDTQPQYDQSFIDFIDAMD